MCLGVGKILPEMFALVGHISFIALFWRLMKG